LFTPKNNASINGHSGTSLPLQEQTVPAKTVSIRFRSLIFCLTKRYPGHPYNSGLQQSQRHCYDFPFLVLRPRFALFISWVSGIAFGIASKWRGIHNKRIVNAETAIDKSELN